MLLSTDATPDTESALTEACATGELLTVSYDGGRHPNTRRRIVVTNMDVPIVWVKELGDKTPKSYLIQKIRLCAADDTSPWMPDNITWTEVQARTHFSDWAFIIAPWFFPALGVTQRTYVDKPKTKAARAQAAAAGGDKTSIAKIRIDRTAYAASSPPQYDFHEGDLFKTGDPAVMLQVAKVYKHKVTQDELIEAHLFQLARETAWEVPTTLFADWLRTGHIPPTAIRVLRNSCKSETGNNNVYDGEFPPP